MTLQEAIEIIGSNGLCDPGVTWADYFKAVQLGREALKRLQVLRAPGPDERYRLLPGETKD